VLYDEVEFTPTTPFKSYNLSVSGVKQLIIRFTGSGGYDRVRYFIGRTTVVMRGNDVEEILVSDEFYDVVRSSSRYAHLITGEAEMGGKHYRNGYTFELGYGFDTGYTGSIVFDFNGGYKKLSFHIGRYEKGKHAAYLRSAKMTITADGKVISGYDKKEIKWNDLALPVEIDVSGVDKLTITLNSSGVDRLCWFIGNIQLESDGHAHGILLDKSSVTLNTNNPVYRPVVRIYPSDVDEANREYDLTIDDDGLVAFFVNEDGKPAIYGRSAGKVTLTATTEDGGHTATCTINSGFPSIKFLPNLNGWGFGNLEVDGTRDFYDDVYERICGEAPSYAMFDSGWQKAVKKIATAPQFLYYSIPRLQLGGGICHGMSLAAAYTYTKTIPFSTWKWNGGSLATTTPYDVKTYSESDGYSNNLDLYLAQLIVACHLSQSAWPTLQEEAASKNDFEALFAAVENFQNTGSTPVLLKLNKYGSVHTVLPYGILKVGDETRMYIYDPNAKRDNHSDLDPNNIYIKFYTDENGKVTNWVYDTIGYYDKSDTSLHPLTNLSVYAKRITQKQKYPFPENVFYISGPDSFEVKNGSAQLVCKNGEYTVPQGQNTLLPMIVAGAADGPSSGDSFIAATPDSELSISFNGSGRTTAGLYLENNAFVVDCGADAQITKSADDRSVTVDSGSDAMVTIRYNSDGASFVVDGRVPDSATVSVDKNDEVRFTGFSLVQLTVIRDGETQTSSMEVVLPDESYIIPDDGQLEIGGSLSFIKPYAFENCASMVSYQIPDGVNAIGEYAFLNCSGLKSMVIPERISYIGFGAFDGCDNLVLTVSKGSYAEVYCRECKLRFISQ